jgi:methanogenic corrinoid protein MtbC1
MDKGEHMQDKELFQEALLKGDRRKASKIAKKYGSSHKQIKFLYENIIKPSLYKVGELWEYNIITVAAEHLATSISESVMNELYENIIAENRTERRVVLGCIENEYHQVGIKMIADVFEMHGWDTFFLGSNIPLKEFIDFTLDNEPHLIALSLSIYSHINNLEAMITKIRETLPGITIIVGGQAFLHGGSDVIDKYNHVILLNDISALEKYILSLNK